MEGVAEKRKEKREGLEWKGDRAVKSGAGERNEEAVILVEARELVLMMVQL